MYKTYRVLGHTADVSLEIYGRTIENLFINSVKGLFHIILPNVNAAKSSIPAKHRRKFSKIILNAATNEELLVQWLNEFIYIFFTKKLWPIYVRIDLLKAGKIASKVIFDKIKDKSYINKEVKAATYHNIKIVKSRYKLKTKVIFDV